MYFGVSIKNESTSVGKALHSYATGIIFFFIVIVSKLNTDSYVYVGQLEVRGSACEAIAQEL